MSAQASRERPRLRVLPGGSERSAEQLSDDELINAFERGDWQTSERLYDRLEDVVSATLTKMMGGQGQDHDDLVQAAFEQILLTLARRKFARACKLTSWAVSVTTNVALNAIRKRRQERRHLSDDADQKVVDVRVSPGAAPDQRVLLQTVRRELANLSPTTATVLVMHDMLGHDLAEISVLTGLSVSAAQSRLVRGRGELRERLQSSFPGARR